MDPRNAYAWLFVFAFCGSILACASPDREVYRASRMDPSEVCDLGILRGTKDMRCDEELSRRPLWGYR